MFRFLFEGLLLSIIFIGLIYIVREFVLEDREKKKQEEEKNGR